MNEEQIDEWRRARFISWWAWIAQRGSKDIASPQDLLPLPGDEEKVNDIRREDFDELFEKVKAVWTPPLERE
jgi:hypothetical protein